MKVKLSSNPEFKFKALNETGYSFDIGASKAVGGDDSGFRPMQLVLAALGSCSGVDVISILKKSRVAFTKLEVEMEAHRAESVPSPFTRIHLKFMLHGSNVDLKKAERAVSLGVDKYCSVAVMLRPGVEITHSVELAN